jgi:hypothetical protein
LYRVLGRSSRLARSLCWSCLMLPSTPLQSFRSNCHPRDATGAVHPGIVETRNLVSICAWSNWGHCDSRVAHHVITIFSKIPKPCSICCHSSWRVRASDLCSGHD